ncbi:MAG: nitrogenase component 1 [Candidatus Bathyarchaeota archaeon]|nr:nitrogenase component 1 [Candidatus Bathyarchaeota archaeon]
MIKNLSKAAHRPDSLSGIVAAFEGISDAYTMLNSPIGCKHPLSYNVDVLGSHVNSEDNAYADFYFGQRRLPCTYTDEQDFVYGTEKKIARAIQLLDLKAYGLIGVINHSGTALIGDDLCRIIQESGIKTRTMVVDSSGFTGTYADGFKTGAIKILERLARTPKEKLPKSVNLIGPTVFHYNWASDVVELKRALRTIGVEVVSVICAGEKIANLERASEAALNLVVCEEYGDSVALFLDKEYGTPSIGLDMYAPFGLSPSETWFRTVADFFHLSHKPIELKSKNVRVKCYTALSRMSIVNNTLRGVPFAIFGDCSQVLALTTFLYEYLGLYPVIIGFREVGQISYDALQNYFAANSLDTSIMVNPDQYEIMDSINEREPVLVFGSSIEEYLSMMVKEPPEFIPISFPYNEKTLLTQRPLIGFNGTLTLVEDILNSFRHYYLTRKSIP